MSNAFIQALLMDDPDVSGGGGPVDPDFPGGCLGFSHYNDALLILNFDGTPGSTTFTDSSTYNRSVTKTWGDAALASGQKFGTACLQGGSTTQLVWNTSGAEWDAPNWTLRCWYYRTSDHSSGHSIFHYGGSSNRPRVQLWTPNDGAPAANYYKVVMWDHMAFAWLISNDPIPLNTWTLIEVAVQKIGLSNTAYLFVNGVLQMSRTALLSSIDFGLYATSSGGSIGRTDQAGFTNINAKIDQWSLTRVCEHTTDYAVPTLPYCNKTTDSSPISIPGTEKLTGIGMTTTAGDVNSPAGFRRLTGQSMTAAAGSVSVFSAGRSVALTGQQMSTFNVARMTPAEYPFLRSGTVTTSVPYLGTPVVFVLRFNSDGSVTQQINGGAITPFFVDTWAYPADGRPNATTTMIPVTAVPNAFKQTFSINKVTAAYTATLAANSSMAAGCTFTFTARASGATYYDYVAIVPTAINPKYGQFGYTSLFYLTFNT